MSVLEQSIGRAIRRGSHNHLPHKKETFVYLYASTLNDKRESTDLTLYDLVKIKKLLLVQLKIY